MHKQFYEIELTTKACVFALSCSTYHAISNISHAIIQGVTIFIRYKLNLNVIKIIRDIVSPIIIGKFSKTCGGQATLHSHSK
jgi:hypothetical protein